MGGFVVSMGIRKLRNRSTPPYFRYWNIFV